MNNGPDDVRDVSEPEVGGEMPEAAMEALLRAEFREPLPLPAGFKERVLARAAAETGGARLGGAGLGGAGLAALDRAGSRTGGAKVLAFPRAAVWRVVAGGALAASLLAGTFGVEMERRHREVSRLARERLTANQQFDEATRITDAVLAHTREQLQRAGVFEDEGR